MFSVILNSFCSFSPEFLQSVPTEEDSVKYQSKQAINEKMKLQSFCPISSSKIKSKEDQSRYQIPKLRQFSFGDRYNENF